jgi:hypothetical protein
MIELALNILTVLFLVLVAVVIFAVVLIEIDKAVIFLVDFFHL